MAEEETREQTEDVGLVGVSSDRVVKPADVHGLPLTPEGDAGNDFRLNPQRVPMDGVGNPLPAIPDADPTHTPERDDDSPTTITAESGPAGLPVTLVDGDSQPDPVKPEGQVVPGAAQQEASAPAPD